MRAVRVRCRHFNGRQPTGLNNLLTEMSMSLVLGWGAYAWAKNTSAILCAKRAGGGLCARGGIFAGHYGICTYVSDLESCMFHS